ncbi:MAG: zf-HC2 domain-containing protein [Planctomycetota bacterium]|nr:zf-HC2 domain-containing protein [Planctomycetota bacterium]
MIDDAMLERLSAYADGELEPGAAAEVEAALRADPALRRALARFQRLTREAAALPVPQLESGAENALWEVVRERTVGGEAGWEAGRWAEVSGRLKAAPEVDEERWTKVWAGISSRTRGASERAVRPADSEAPIAADLTPGELPAVAGDKVVRMPERRVLPIWPAAGVLAAAAAVILTLTLGLAVLRENGPEDPGKGPAVARQDPGPGPLRQVKYDPMPEVLDDRYQMVVKNIPGIEEPVLCFFLKEEEPAVHQR